MSNGGNTRTSQMNADFKSLAARRLAATLSQRTVAPVPTAFDFDFDPVAVVPRPREREDITWEQIRRMWNPPKAQFSPSTQWLEMLKRLGIPLDEVHTGRERDGILMPPFDTQNLSHYSSPKTGLLVTMITDLDDKGVGQLQDMKGEVTAYFHSLVLERYSLRRGSVLTLKDCTVLPRNSLNVLLSNVSEVIQ